MKYLDEMREFYTDYNVVNDMMLMLQQSATCILFVSLSPRACKRDERFSATFLFSTTTHFCSKNLLRTFYWQHLCVALCHKCWMLHAFL